MAFIGLNEVARKVAEVPGKYKPLPAGQEREVISKTLRVMSFYWKNQHLAFTVMMDRNHRRAYKSIMERQNKGEK